MVVTAVQLEFDRRFVHCSTEYPHTYEDARDPSRTVRFYVTCLHSDLEKGGRIGTNGFAR